MFIRRRNNTTGAL